MTKRMLLDASHPEETRVVVLSGNRLEDFDSETTDKKPLKGNIYLAKVTRVEPSLQAAFVDYGGNRHGFLPFSEIHPDYYRLPIADREALLAEEQAAQRGDDDGDGEVGNGAGNDEPDAESEAAAAGAQRRSGDERDGEGGDPEVEQVETTSSVETLAGDEIEDAARRRAAFLGRYKIQEVIKRRQVILVQVVKEERGTKGAALTTYLSLAGRYCVLMPNTNKGGGISRKIANAKDRRRLKGILSELNIPEGMAIIVRTAGSNRTKAEIKRDYEYLLRLWDHIRETTLQSTAPCLIYEEANLMKRAIRDLYTRDMDQVLVEGEEGYKAAKTFMRSLMPSHAKKVQKYEDPKEPLFHRHQVEAQLDNIHNPTVQLKSGGYIVLNQTEALVAIDVNSGKATKERHIEETALKTNLEAAEEVARQLKLRDLAGLIVIDFIDMDAAKNNREVEQRLKDAMRQDRARIQLGRISPFGLLELSRQRLRPSLHETSTEVCRICGGSGFVRSPESTALHVLRALEEEGIRRGGGEIALTLPTGVALYTLNEKRGRLIEIERRYGFRVRIQTDDELVPPAYRLDRLSTAPAAAKEAEEAEPADTAEKTESTPEAADQSGKSRKRGRRGGRKKRRTEEGELPAEATASAEEAVADAGAENAETAETDAAEGDGEHSADSEADELKATRRRRRGKRGGRRRSRRREEGAAATQAGEEPGAVPDAVAGPAEGETSSAADAEGTAAAAEARAAAASAGTDPAVAEAATVDDGPGPTETEAAGAEAAQPAKQSRRGGSRRKSARKTAEAQAPVGADAPAGSTAAAGDDGAGAEGASSADATASAEEAAADDAAATPAKARSKTRAAGAKKATTSSSAGKSRSSAKTTRGTGTGQSGAKAASGSASKGAAKTAAKGSAKSGSSATGRKKTAAGRKAPPKKAAAEKAAAEKAAGEQAGEAAADTPVGAGSDQTAPAQPAAREPEPADAGHAAASGGLPGDSGGEAAEPQGGDESSGGKAGRGKRRGWWQKLMS